MPNLSTAGWIVHDVGLATNIGGSLFGYLALEPGLKEVTRADERDRVSEKAWSRFSWLKLAGHVAFAVPWFIGRGMLTGKEVTDRARSLTLAKDVLVGVSLISGVTSFIIGRMLSKKVEQGAGPEQNAPESRGLERAVSIVGAINTAATAGVLGVTAALAMEASKSPQFAMKSRRLP